MRFLELNIRFPKCNFKNKSKIEILVTVQKKVIQARSFFTQNQSFYFFLNPRKLVMTKYHLKNTARETILLGFSVLFWLNI